MTTDTEANSRAIAEISVIEKSFSIDGRREPVLRDISIDVQEDEFVTFLGPSGCGKTTLLRLIAGLDEDFEGVIKVGGKPIDGPGKDRGLVFQESRLFPWMRVETNVRFAISDNVNDREDRVSETLEDVELSSYRRAWPSQLSGGMEKRVALARALVNQPQLLLLDEPFSALDEPTKYRLQNQLAALRVRGKAQATILVTHDVDEAVYLSDRVFILSTKPAHIAASHCIDLPFPRDRRSSEFRAALTSVTDSVFVNSLPTESDDCSSATQPSHNARKEDKQTCNKLHEAAMKQPPKASGQ